MGILVESLPHEEVNNLTDSQCLSGTHFQIASLNDGSFFPMWFTTQSGWLGTRVNTMEDAVKTMSRVNRGQYGGN